MRAWEILTENMSYTAAEIRKIEKERNIKPGTEEWFQLWFSRPYLTGEKPRGKRQKNCLTKNGDVVK